MQRFYRYHELFHQKEMNKRQLENSSRGKHKPPYWMVFKACFPQCFNTFLIFFVTLALFPSVQSDIYSSDENFVIPSKYYASVMCFLTFNITAMLGSSIASLVQWVCKLQFYMSHFILYLYFIFFLYFTYILHYLFYYIATKLWLSNICVCMCVHARERDVYCINYIYLIDLISIY